MSEDWINNEHCPKKGQTSPVKDSYADPWVDAYIAGHTDSKKVLFHLLRTKNYNTVMFEAVTKEDGSLDDKMVCNYWFDIDRDPMTKTRKKGNTSDRSETNFFENKMAYGISASKKEDGKIICSITALKKRTFELVCTDGDYSLQGVYDNKPAKIRKVYVEMKDGWTGPTIVYVKLFWEALEGGDILTETINP